MYSNALDRIKAIREILKVFEEKQALFDESGLPHAKLRALGEMIHDIGGVRAMDAVTAAYPVALQYVWDGVRDYTVPSARRPSRGTAVISSNFWGVLPHKPRTQNDMLGFIRFFLYPIEQQRAHSPTDLEWIHANIRYKGSICLAADKTWGYMNCTNTTAELLAMGILVSLEGSDVPYPDVCLPRGIPL